MSTEKKFEEDLFNEMSSLNNEMINAQRTLAKQNAEIRELNLQLYESNSKLEMFCYLASHDLQEPLRMVTGFIGLLKSKYSDKLDSKALSYIDFAIDGAARMKILITNLLEFSRLGREENIQIADVNELLTEVKENMGKSIEESKAEIFVPAILPVIPLHRMEFSRLLQNLISNSIKFRIKNQAVKITLSAIENTTEWEFTVADNGIGIESKNFKKIFEIFSRLHPQQLFDGTGIGLAICKKIVQHHGGRIWVESEKGMGARFCFTISKELKVTPGE